MQHEKPLDSCNSCASKTRSKRDQYPDHSKEIIRINRIVGQMSGIQRMIEDRRYCPEILQQIKAAGAAIKALENKILEKHLRTCVKEAMLSKNPKEVEKKIDELMDLLR